MIVLHSECFVLAIREFEIEFRLIVCDTNDFEFVAFVCKPNEFEFESLGRRQSELSSLSLK